MKDLSIIGEELFNKIRGRFNNVTIGDENGTVTSDPSAARFFDFNYAAGGKSLGKVSVSVSEDEGLTVIYSQDFITNESDLVQKDWYNFLRELRQFARKRMLTFDTRDINKSNLQKRDYKFLAQSSGDEKMTESKLYGTSMQSYQKIGEARLVIKHTHHINQESATGRTQKIGKIYIESPEGERFKYPYKHLSGARAMAMHVSEGGNAYDDFGKHIVGLSEEMAKLRKFKTYMGRSAVMAESLAGYMDVVKERIATVKKTIENLQKPAYYKEAVEGFESPVLEDVPADVAENWIDELTIKQFNEELQDIFPYIYNLVKEGTRAKALGPDDLVDESALMAYAGKKKHGAEYMKKAAEAGRKGASQEELGRLKDKYSKAEKNKKTKEELELEAAFEATLGQFSDHVCEDCGNPSWTTLGMSEDEIDEAEKKGLYYYVNKRKKAGTSRSKNHPDAPSDQDWKDAAKTAKKESTEEETNEEKKKGSHGKVCWKGFRRGEGNDCHRVVRDEDDLDEAYVKTAKDAIDTLGQLRKIGKKIETGQDTFDGNLANMYANDVYDVISWVENNLDTNDANYQKVLGPVVELRKKAKGMEREPGSGKNARFGNEIVNTLYPLMQWIEMAAQNAKEGTMKESNYPHLTNFQELYGIEDEEQYKDMADDAQYMDIDEFEDTYSNVIDMAGDFWEDHQIEEGNEFAKKVRDLKAAGGKKGDKFKTSDGEEHVLEKQKTPLGEFILSYYDRETGEFPKGETAVLTMVEKDYGEQFIEPAKAFIESIHQTFEAFQQSQPRIEDDPEYQRMRELAGLR